MKLTDAERLILINQYTILLELLPKTEEARDQSLTYRNLIEELELGIHEGQLNFPNLQESTCGERVNFALQVCDMIEVRKIPFYGFRDERLNAVAKYWGTPIKKGTPPSDDEYRVMLAKKAA
jgi:uncharacterized protein YfbU (UPF0304 family)